MASAQHSDGAEQFVYFPLRHPKNLRLFYLPPGIIDETIILEMFELPTSDPDGGSNGIDEADRARLYSLPKDRETFWDTGAYYALSYVWGDASDTIPIQVNDCPFDITKNLHGLLKHLRRSDIKSGPYWADAICINQMDNVEKGAQVGMMDKIYSKSKYCVVWLGEESALTKEAFRIFYAVAEKARVLYEKDLSFRTTTNPDCSLEPPSTSPTRMPDDNMLAVLSSEKFQDELHNELLSTVAMSDHATPEERSLRAWELAWDVFSRPWFRRMWTLQEFYLPLNLHVTCGTARIDAESLSIGCQVYLQSALSMVPPIEDNNDRFVTFVNVCAGRYLKRRQSHLAELVNIYREREATNPRDMIYALCSLAKEASFSIDYRKTVEEVYTNFAAWSIGEGMLNIILQNTVGNTAASCLPTWVPDWRIANTLQAFTLQNVFYAQMYRGAGGSAMGRAHFSDDLTALFVDGVILGRIEAVCSDVTWNSELVQMLRTLLVEQYSFSDPQGSGQGLEEAMLRTIRSDIRLIDGDATAERLDVTWPSQDMSEEDIFEYPYRRDYDLFFSTNGYLGQSRKGAGRDKDFVAIIKGATLPVILRRKDAHFELVDACGYVHGAMDGEIMEDVASGKRKFEEIELR